MQQHFSEEELRETFQRAREITEQSRDLAAPEAQYEDYLKAAEELGIPREATLQALRERLLISGEAFTEGHIVFAPSVDGFWYPATLLTLNEHTVTVRFLSGAEHTCARSDLRPLSLLPGRKLEADIPNWGWFGVTVDKHNEEKGKVTVRDWADEKYTVPLAKIRLSAKAAAPPSRKEQRSAQAKGALMRVGLLAGSVGLAAGFVLDRLLPLVLPFLR